MHEKSSPNFGSKVKAHTIGEPLLSKKGYV
jgi:hypothetical protein